MSFNTFNPARLPTNYSRNTKIRTKSNTFGDGYEQTILDGINAQYDELSLTWSNLTIPQAQSIDSFISDQKTIPFKWTAPQQSSEKTWRCIEWSTSYHEDSADITATFTEVFV